MSANRRWGPWFRLTEQEKELIERLMAEADAWKPGMPLPEHSIDEHLAGLRPAVHDAKAGVQRWWLLFVLWVLTWVVLIGLVILALVRWLS